MPVPYSFSSPLSETIPHILNTGAENHLMHTQCAMRTLIEEYISSHSIETLGELLECGELYYERTLFFGLGLMLLHPCFDGFFISEARAKFLEFALKDHFSTQLNKFVFYSGLPYPFNDIPIDKGLSEQFGKDIDLLAIQREFVL